MAEKTKVVLLGFNENIISHIAEKMNSSRPVQVSYFTELKEFLAFCMDHKPTIAGISVAYPHKSVAKFPRLFKMAFGIPVISFCESQDLVARRTLAASQTDYKIPGVVTAHNMWMKIVNFQRDSNGTEEKQAETEAGPQTPGTFVLKGGKSNAQPGDRGSVLSSLLAAMEDGKPVSESNMNIVSSGDATGFQRDEAHIIKKDDDDFIHSSSELEGEEANQVTGGSGDDHEGMNLVHQDSVDDEEDSSDANNDFAAALDEYAEAKARELAGMVGGEDIDSSTNHDNNDDDDNDASDDSRIDESSNSEAVDFANALSAMEASQAADESSHSLDPADSTKTAGAPELESGDFGKVKLKDANEVRAHEGEKQKERNRKEEQKTQNILIECNEIALKTVFLGNASETPKPFQSENIAVFIVEMEGYQGFLTLANHLNQDAETAALNKFRAVLLENLEKNDYFAEISHPYTIRARADNYFDIVRQFSEFVIFHNEESGKQQIVSFIKREVVRPQYEESDRDGMYLIKFKVIPPQTPVNFDAFLYLPKNNRFVRYLKEGRSLSLAQSNRHSEIEANHRLYLAKDNLDKFIQFYIQNTVSWEFAIYQKPKKDVA